MLQSYHFTSANRSTRNRIALAPMTNTQSEPDGSLSQQEQDWLVARAKGGFGIVITCAARVSEHGHGWPGQLAVASDRFVPALTGLATELREAGSLSIVQLAPWWTAFAENSQQRRAGQCCGCAEV